MKRRPLVMAAFVLVVFAAASTNARALPRDDKPSHELPFEQVAGDNGDYDTLPGDWPPAGTYRVLVDVTNQVLTVYRTDDGQVVRQCLCSTGTTKTPTPPGTFQMQGKRRRFSIFTGYESAGYGQYMTKINDKSWFHSIIYKKKDAATYTVSYKNLGTRQSHGCIRLPVPDARWIYFNLAPGSEVTVTGKLPRDKALRESLKLPPVPKVRLKNLSNVPQIFAEGGENVGTAKSSD